LKYVLTCCRDYWCILDRDKRFLQKVWPVIKHLIAEALECWDQDGDCMIENFVLTVDAYGWHHYVPQLHSPKKPTILRQQYGTWIY
uniref:DUF608 domain-containing protein n=1 Tax=Gongylonema pulchrum TaxID=637853 RepID=A0A183DAG0_9BILA